MVAILNSAGTAVATYSYEAWGGLISYEGTMGSLNPLRYRGYVYDEETGLYYLQSRYYDPGKGRFINVDAYAATGQGFTGNNAFIYCNNRPVISADYSGYDAIILLDTDFVGHIGIMAQDESGSWWHFYWGSGAGGSSSSNQGSSGIFGGYVATLFGNVPAKKWCKPYAGNLTLESINDSRQYSDYEKMCYLSDDFSSCVSDMKNIGGEYNLWNRNCSQVSLGILAKADTEYKEFLSDIMSVRLPVTAFRKLKLRVDLLHFFETFVLFE